MDSRLLVFPEKRRERLGAAQGLTGDRKKLRFSAKGLEFRTWSEPDTPSVRSSLGGLFAPGAAKPWAR